jgi:hypothetical protein
MQSNYSDQKTDQRSDQRSDQRFDTLYLDEKKEHEIGIDMGSYIVSHEINKHVLQNQLDRRQNNDKSNGWLCCVISLLIIISMGIVVIFLIGVEQGFL